MPSATAAPDNYCPFGCTHAELDEHGYCDHLVGWTSNEKTYEKLVRGKRGLRQIDCNVREGDGTYRRVVHEIPADAVLVNPIVPQLVDTLWHQTKKWVSARVYRRNVTRTPSREEVIVPEEVVPADQPETETALVA